ncbi:SLAM family member 5-like [Limanda limanda]|uniref:SLAM family member 5-like n=1 Tax=Limanda limanda TaxID=27771 RepID=UPI0029C62E06|nr:SLAM family member 5-like [Limanda limanda]
MHPIVLLFVISLLHAYEARGSYTGTPVFVQKGKDLLLHVTAPVKLFKRSEFKWQFNDSIILRLFPDNETKIIDPYHGRVEFFLQNYSFLLKNVQQADSGSYTAAVFGNDITYVGKYSVTVQDPVSLVNGTVDFLSSSSNSCNLTVTCSTQDSHRINSTFRCDNNTCSQEDGEERSKVTTSGSSLRVYLSETFSVICSHSNQVSSDEDITMIRDFCFLNPGKCPTTQAADNFVL